MSIPDYVANIKVWWGINSQKVFVSILIAAIGVLGFALGRLSAKSYQGASLGGMPVAVQPVVASKSRHAYYYPWCLVALNLAGSDTVWFDSANDADTAGYKAALNCRTLTE